MDKEKNEFGHRVSLMSFFFATIGFIIVFRLINLQIIHHDDLIKKLDNKLTTTQHYLSSRGNIYTRDGVVLAYDAPSYQLEIKVDELTLMAGLTEELDYSISPKSSRFTDLRSSGTLAPSKSAMMTKIKNSEQRLSREPLLMDLAHLNNFPIEKLVRAVQESFENCLKGWANLNTWQNLDLYLNEKGAQRLIEQPERYSGFSCNMDAIRSYPQGELASNIIGYLGKLNEKDYNVLRMLGYYPHNEDRNKPIVLTPLESRNLSWVRNYTVGVDGIEKLFNNSLRGRLHEKLIIRGKGEIPSDEENSEGKDVHLTIDYTLQSIAREAMNGRQGSVVLIDMDSGDILVSVSTPSYDPNIISPPTNTSFHKYLQSRPGMMINRSTGNHYPFGSIYKIITAVAAIEENIITPEKTYFCGKKHQRTGLNCLGYHSDIAIDDALRRSCNIFFYECALEMGPVKLYNWSRKFYLGESLNSGLPNEKSGIIPNRLYKRSVSDEMWYPGDTCHMAIGQGFQLGTPLQAAVVAGLVSRDKGMVRPQYWQHKDRDTLKLDISPYTREIVRKGLFKVVNQSHGTAYIAHSDMIEYAGKTGTADVFRQEPHAWFAGFAPYSDPKVAIAVIVENGGHGGDVAAPIAKQVLEAWQQKYQLASR